MASAGISEPSGVTLNTIRPGISLLPGVPSTSIFISAAIARSVPSFPKKNNDARLSPLCTTVGADNVPRLRQAKIPDPADAVVLLA
jgi:hypothetical protein